LDRKAHHTAIIKRIAHDLGFEACGIAEARFLEEEANKLENWLKKDFHGRMDYMANNFDLRLDPKKLVPGAKSVVSLLFNYYPDKDLAKEGNYKVAKYAYGEDYHFVLKRKLKTLLQRASEEIGEINGRAFVDSAPVMERQWAQLAGLGWLGKNSLLLNKRLGSFYFIAELIIDLPLIYDNPITTDHCGSCTRCIDACPTDAIVGNGVVDASKCISYYTIELKSEFSIESDKNFENWVFGCDICQDVCPWNRFSKPNTESSFLPSPEFEQMNKQSWQELTEDVFQKLFRKSPLKRTKLTGIQRNINFIEGQD
jgi:epoxyqueuosine reductase